MKKFVIFLLLVAALVGGYLIGNKKADRQGPKARPYTYNLQLPKELSGESAAFSGVVHVISPLVANISTSRTVSSTDSSHIPHSLDNSFGDFF